MKCDVIIWSFSLIFVLSFGFEVHPFNFKQLNTTTCDELTMKGRYDIRCRCDRHSLCCVWGKRKGNAEENSLENSYSFRRLRWLGFTRAPLSPWPFALSSLSVLAFSYPPPSTPRLRRKTGKAIKFPRDFEHNFYDNSLLTLLFSFVLVCLFPPRFTHSLSLSRVK